MSGSSVILTSFLRNTLLPLTVFESFKNIKIDDINFNDIEFKFKPSTKSSEKAKVNSLITEYKNGSLVLVLGAGVSIDYGLPSWDMLLQKLLIEAFSTKTKEDSKVSTVLAELFTNVFPLNPLISARFLQNYYKKNKKDGDFESDIRNIFYNDIKIDYISPTFKEIFQLCVAPGNSPNLNSIITYNYDDLLEKHLDDLDIDVPYKSIYKVGQNHTPNELPIYHVHGFLKRDGDLSPDDKIILSEDLYHQQYNDTYSWNNIVQINKFRENTCLFIGISLSDPNTRRLLDIANLQKGSLNKYHYIIKKRYDRDKIKKSLEIVLSQDNTISNEKTDESLGIDKTVNYLVEFMETFEEEDAMSFGVKTIWVKEFSEIPSILIKIRKMYSNSKVNDSVISNNSSMILG